MKKLLSIVMTLGLLGQVGCKSMGGNSDKGTARAAQELLMEDHKALAEADAEYKDAILNHGVSSSEAVQAKARLEQARAKYIADQQNVSQWQRVQKTHPDPVEAATGPTAADLTGTEGTSGATPSSR